MGYHQLATTGLYDIYRRWHEGQTASHIAKASQLDRKTVRKYISRVLMAGLVRQMPLIEKEQFFESLGDNGHTLGRGRTQRELLRPYEEELRRLITDPKEPVKPKTAFLIVSEKYRLAVSYETFKIYAREQQLCRLKNRSIIRIELPAGKETQLDYGQVGRHHNTQSGANHIVWAFCATLSHSRLPFIQFVYTQKAGSFAESVIDMAEFYQGVTEALSVDNLKAAVIKADLWDPTLNRSLAEVAEHYGFFIDPCRVARPTDKGKVERLVPVARELFRRLKALHPNADLAELNRRALQWCREEYGMKRHGTTGMAPLQVYQEVEKAVLRTLPAERFEVGIWKPAKVHEDRFVSIERKYYAVPADFKEKTVWLRKTPKILRIFDERYRLVRQYSITGKLRSYLPQDFPEGRRELMDGSYPRFLLRQAEGFGEAAGLYIQFLLVPHAYLNARRARAVLSLMAEYHGLSSFNALCLTALRRSIRNPKAFKVLCEDERQQLHLRFPIALSETGRAMVRPISHFFTPQGGLDGDTTSLGTAPQAASNARDAVNAGSASR